MDAFLNGQQVNSFLIPGGVKQFMYPCFGIGDIWAKYGEQVNSYVDELMIFRARAWGLGRLRTSTAMPSTKPPCLWRFAIPAWNHA